MADDVLVTLGARASVAMAFPWLSRDTPVPEGLNYLRIYKDVMTCKV